MSLISCFSLVFVALLPLDIHTECVRGLILCGVIYGQTV